MWPPLQPFPPVRQPSTPPARRPTPAAVPDRPGATQDGDVLIRTRPGLRPAFTLSEVPGLDQVTYPTRADAVHCASDYARQHGVDVWGEDTSGVLIRLAHFRPAGAASDRPPAAAWPDLASPADAVRDEA
jgi:hypothetical protein